MGLDEKTSAGQNFAKAAKQQYQFPHNWDYRSLLYLANR